MNDFNPFSLEGKTILVTGASSGIGRATAIECSKMGARVIATARDEERLNEMSLALIGERHTTVIADLVNPTDIDALISSLPTIDGLMLCAGKGLTLPMQFATREKFDEIFNVNFFSQIELLRLLFKKKKIAKGGSVVIVSSLGGIKVFSGGNGIYGAGKAALSSAAKFCAKEFAPRLIRVNCICPGMIDTPLIHRGTVTDEQLAEDAKRYPLKRYGKPNDVAHLATFLLSEASSWITGQDIIIDGGVSLS